MHRCSRCGLSHDAAAWRTLAVAQRLSAGEVGALVVGWPEDVCVEIRVCSGCGHAIAAKAPSPGYAGPPRA